MPKKYATSQPEKGKRLSDEQIAAIRAEPADMSLRQIAAKHQVGLNTAARYRVRKGTPWASASATPARPAPVAASAPPSRQEEDTIVLRGKEPWGTIEVSISRAGLLAMLLDKGRS